MVRKLKRPKTEKLWVSAISATPELPVEVLRAMIPSGPLQVFLLHSTNPIGKAVAYELREDTIWARIEIKGGLRFSRAMSFLDERTTPPRIAAIILTELSREGIRYVGSVLRQGGSRVN